MKHNNEQKVDDNLRPPVFWQTPCYRAFFFCQYMSLALIKSIKYGSKTLFKNFNS